MGDGPIPWSSIEEYAILNEYEADQKEQLHYFVSVMDAEFLKWKSKKDGRSKNIRK